MTANGPFCDLKVGLMHGMKDLAGQDLMLWEAEGSVVRAGGNPGGEKRGVGGSLWF